MPLFTKTQAYQVVNYNDLDRFVKEITGQEWEFPAAQECGNDTEHTFSPTGKHWSIQLHNEHPDWTFEQCHAPGLNEYDQAKMDRFLAGDRDVYPHPQMMLDWLVAQRHILPGNYLIEVSW